MFPGLYSNPLRIALLTVATLTLVLALSLPRAKAEIEEAVLECRKTCIEQQCVLEYQTCMTKTSGSPQACRALREDCETTCVTQSCLP